MAVRADVAEGVAEVVLDRPEVMNALDEAAVRDLHAALDASESPASPGSTGLA